MVAAVMTISTAATAVGNGLYKECIDEACAGYIAGIADAMDTGPVSGWVACAAQFND